MFFFNTDIDECASNPCHNNGTCNNNIGEWNCTCPAGWAQPDCSTGQIFDTETS